MKLDPSGFMRPSFETSVDKCTKIQRSEFRDICPGRRVAAVRDKGTERHPYFGPILNSWQAWATDDKTREAGSSGGTITALTTWLIENNEGFSVVGAKASEDNPRVTVPITIMSKEDALKAAGSRYAPVANLAAANAMSEKAFVGKPCEASALSRLAAHRQSDEIPLLISFFCAGVPSQNATNSLVEKLGVGLSASVTSLRYRGDGWPGQFHVTDSDGKTGSMTYDQSWGKELGPTMQWRCKICPDGVGESADIVAGDYWASDESGYPVFSEQDGVSVLIARTIRGRNCILAAASAGVIQLQSVDLDNVAEIQPLQTLRRRTVFGRLTGRLLAGKRVPRYSGFGLASFVSTAPLANLRALAGTYRRSV